MLEFYQTHPVRDCPEYTCFIDEHRDGLGEQMLLVHLEVHQFSPSVLKKLLAEWRVLRSCVEAPLFCMGTFDDAKYTRFMHLLGFEHFHTLPPEGCTDGISRRVFVSNRNIISDGRQQDADQLPDD